MSTNKKHTPGPWNWYEHNKKEPESGPVKVETKDRVIAEIVWCGVGQHEERKANALLIAAAPELLEALEKLLSFPFAESCQECGIGNSEEWEAAKAAISKAKG